MADVQKINSKDIDQQFGFDFMEEIRDGYSTDMNTMKAAAIFRTLIDKVNEIIDRLKQLEDANGILYRQIAQGLPRKPKGGKQKKV